MSVSLSLFTITTKSHWIYAIHHPYYILNLVLCINTIHVYYGPTNCKISHMLQFARSSISHTWLKNLFPISGTQSTKLKEKSQRDKFEVVSNCRTLILFTYACNQCCHGPNVERKRRGRWDRGKGKKRKKGK